MTLGTSQTLRLAFATQGQGPQLTLVPGWGLGAGAWRLAAHLLARHFTVHVVDLPGYGASPAAPGATLADLADGLAAVLPPRSMVCGWSLGALVALLAARRHPRTVARLVLVAGTASFVRRDGWGEALPPAQLAAFQASLAADPAALLKQFAGLIHQGDARRKDVLRALRGCLEDVPGGLPADPASLAQGLDLLASSDLRADLAAVDQPTLLVHGGADPLMPLAAAQRLARELPAATLSVFADSAHAPFASEPLRFAAEVTAFAGVAS